jgi:glycosyltransferase involved in cell wall biosynthesis
LNRLVANRTAARHPRYSVVIPVYNEVETLLELERRLSAIFDRLDGRCEVILVDDASTDGSFELAARIAERDPRFRVLRLSRNFGHQVAITAGLEAADGDAVIVMDGDLQDPPEVILELASRWRDGFEVVHAVRVARKGEPRFRALRASIFYRVLRRLTEIDIPVDVGDFRLVDRRALEAFMSMRERNRYVRGMFSWVGFRQTTVGFIREERYAGVSKYPFRKLVKLASDGMISFSSAPLRLALRLGFAISALSLLFAFASVVAKLAGLYPVPGTATLAVLVAFFAGVQLTMLGIQGEYIARIQDEVKARPLYFITETRGFGDQRAMPVRIGPLDAGIEEGLAAAPYGVARAHTRSA